MWNTQMQRRCPESKKLGVAILRSFRWIISMRGYANVVKSADDEVEGVLFQISDADEESLDGFEGVDSGSYVKRDLPVLHANQEQRALVYIDPVTTEGNPKAEYVNRINAALRDAQLPPAYVINHVRRFIPEEPT
ncbi:MAG: gamma-glutamylcyclotransferase [Candidatus Eisenbacteria sp.]|nr:gamma-glutamylcyclotransferase [Candidatus Eisenbacteria bacterium]